MRGLKRCRAQSSCLVRDSVYSDDVDADGIGNLVSLSSLYLAEAKCTNAVLPSAGGAGVWGGSARCVSSFLRFSPQHGKDPQADKKHEEKEPQSTNQDDCGDPDAQIVAQPSSANCLRDKRKNKSYGSKEIGRDRSIAEQP